MIVRFFKTGISNGESPVRYVLSKKDNQDRDRPEPPQILLGGNAKLTVDLINGISRKYKYASGCLAFRPDEQPTKQGLEKILDEFLSVVSPGLKPEQVNSLFVLHKENPDRKTGLAGFHVHFILPMVVLSGDQAGNRWNPHPPGQKTIEKMEAFTKVINHENGWAQVAERPNRIGVNSFWRKVDGKRNARKLEFLEQHLQKGIQSGAIKDRDGLINFLENELGCTITRRAENYLSIKPPGALKAMRLKGKMFESQTDYAREFSTHSPNSRTVSKLTVQEYTQAKARLKELQEGCKPDILGSRPKSIKTRKDKYGSQQASGIRTKYESGCRSSGRHKDKDECTTGQRPSGQSAYRGHMASHHRHTEKAQSALLGNTTERGGLGLRQGLGSSSNKPEHSGTHSNTSPPDSRSFPSELPAKISNGNHRQNQGIKESIQSANLPAHLLKSAGTLDEINDQLRQLGMAMSHASYEGQAVIQNQINTLVGRRERLPKPK